MAGTVDHETEQATRKILSYWFDNNVDNWTITDRTVIATAELLGATNECNSVFKLVPTPSGAFTGLGTMGSMAFNYAKDAVIRAATDKSYYHACIKSQALYRRSELESTTF